MPYRHDGCVCMLVQVTLCDAVCAVSCNLGSWAFPVRAWDLGFGSSWDNVRCNRTRDEQKYMIVLNGRVVRVGTDKSAQLY
jgi:hypothetical protein